MKTIDRLLDSLKTDAARPPDPGRRLLDRGGAGYRSARCGLASTLRAEGRRTLATGNRAGAPTGAQRAGAWPNCSVPSASWRPASAWQPSMPCWKWTSRPDRDQRRGDHSGTGSRAGGWPLWDIFPSSSGCGPTAAECWVLELQPGPGDLPAEQAAEVLPQADVVALTGTSLINHTFDELMALCRRDAFVLLARSQCPADAGAL